LVCRAGCAARHASKSDAVPALLAGGMLARAPSFDEVIVTTFTARQETCCRPVSSASRPPAPAHQRRCIVTDRGTLVPALVACSAARHGGIAGRGNQPGL